MQTSTPITRRPEPNDYERHVEAAHNWHRIALARQAEGDRQGSADAAVLSLISASIADPFRARESFAQLRADCLTIQGGWFKRAARSSSSPVKRIA